MIRQLINSRDWKMKCLEWDEDQNKVRSVCVYEIKERHVQGKREVDG